MPRRREGADPVSVRRMSVEFRHSMRTLAKIGRCVDSGDFLVGLRRDLPPRTLLLASEGGEGRQKAGRLEEEQARVKRPSRPLASVENLRNHVKLDPVHESVLVDRPRVSGAPTQRFAILLARSTHVRPCHAGEGHQLDRVDLDPCQPSRVSTSRLDLGAAPKPERHGDASRSHPVAQLRAELH